MNLNLPELPTEVLTNVVSYTLLECTCVDYADGIGAQAWTKQLGLHAHCLTSRRISAIAREVLLKHVWLVPGGEVDDLQDPEFEQL